MPRRPPPPPANAARLRKPQTTRRDSTTAHTSAAMPAVIYISLKRSRRQNYAGTRALLPRTFDSHNFDVITISDRSFKASITDRNCLLRHSSPTFFMGFQRFKRAYESSESSHCRP
ncbi:hypothetical protein EVAR_94824_1 [Eumeta japonica]|uniref:Uncharacterized protein n=1 Tax=Eumeta variegata TaxID=151549 RepID=A0A4C1UIU8_EUMVA|nr:hypothetical protein EVAR_94824_1 [Eumeta japonica]